MFNAHQWFFEWRKYHSANEIQEFCRDVLAICVEENFTQKPIITNHTTPEHWYRSARKQAFITREWVQEFCRDVLAICEREYEEENFPQKLDQQ